MITEIHDPYSKNNPIMTDELQRCEKQAADMAFDRAGWNNNNGPNWPIDIISAQSKEVVSRWW